MTDSIVDDPLIGQRLANYRVERVLRRGGMAQVYYGWDVKLDRPVAIKVIDVRYRSDPTYAERFVHEARAIAAWRHEHIVHIYYADDEDGLFYYVMEYVDGMDLSRLIGEYAADGELIPPEDVLTIGRAVAGALDYAHDKGVIHRDVKPSNVMVSVEGRVLLTDFGLALTVESGSQGEILGTPHYVAPEQAHRSADAVPQSDLYSLGVILYELLTGVVPFDDPSPTALALQHITEPPPPPRRLNPRLNAETEAVLLKALSKAPEDRYQTGAGMMDALDAALAAGPPDEEPVDLPPLPAGIQARTASTASRISRLSVVERIAMQVGKQKPTPEPSPAEPDRARQLWLAGGVSLVLLLVLLLALPRIFGWDGLWAASDPTATATRAPAALAEEPTATPSVTAIPPTETPRPTATGTAPATLRPSSTPSPTAIPPTATATATATRPGRALRLFYDDASLYVWNPNSRPVDVGMLAFEALDASGNPAGRAFQGRDWAAFYPRLEAGDCNGLELAGRTTVLEPYQCNGYNAVLTLFPQDDRIFWVMNPGTGSQFRVFWQGREIGRCPIAAGVCRLTLPES